MNHILNLILRTIGIIPVIFKHIDKEGKEEFIYAYCETKIFNHKRMYKYQGEWYI